jgi:hypothetical protein
LDYDLDSQAKESKSITRLQHHTYALMDDSIKRGEPLHCSSPYRIPQPKYDGAARLLLLFIRRNT